MLYRQLEENSLQDTDARENWELLLGMLIFLRVRVLGSRSARGTRFVRTDSFSGVRDIGAAFIDRSYREE